ncbi:MAG: helix-turn-helix domain-containing protein, partial [Aestuariibacter sp.]|nr:helix-turn-helix domain-containing protein [Aestuariibacter sp.]
MSDNKVLLSPSEAAEILNISPVTLRQWSQKGRIPFQ